jgi:TonB family protein
MNSHNGNTLLTIPLHKERYGHPLLVSIAIHLLALVLVVFGGGLFSSTVIKIGSGPGGGTGGDVSSVGVVDELSGGAGMFKPSITPKPPALKEELPEINKSKAISLPETIDTKKKKPELRQIPNRAKVAPDTNMIPTRDEAGSGGAGGSSGGVGGGIGGGSGISIGSGSGEFGNHWYPRMVENRISSSWIRPPDGKRIVVIYSFYIDTNGTINNIQKDQSSGDMMIDMAAERAIRAANTPPLPPPPPEFRGRPIQFVAKFVYPPNQ